MKKQAHIFLLLLCLFFARGLQNTKGADLIWNGGDSGVWTNSGGGWLSGATPATWNNATPDTALFTGTSPTNVAVAGNGVTVSDIGVSGSNYVFSGGALALNDTTWFVDSGRLATVSNNLTGATTLTKTGAGTLFMGANNLLSATMHVVVSEGAFNLRQGVIASLTLDGGTITGGAATITAANYYLNGGRVDQRLGAGNVIVSTGTTTLGTSMVTNNAITIESGSLVLANSNRIVEGSSVTISGGSLNMSNFSNTIGSLVMSGGSLTGAGKLTATTYVLSGGTLSAPTGAGTMTITNGQVTLNGTTDAGTVNINTGGTLFLGGNNRVINTSSLVVDGGTFNMAAFNQTLSSVVLRGGGELSAATDAVVLVSANTYELESGTVTARLGGATDPVGLTKTTAGTVVLTASNTYVGTTTIAEGVLRIGHARALGTSQSGTIVASGAALEMSNNIAVGSGEALSLSGAGVSSGGALRNVSGDNSYAGAITLAANARINSDVGTLTVSGAVGGAGRDLAVGGAGNTLISGVIGTSTGSLTKDGVGVLTLSANNTFSGGTIINGGTLRIGDGGTSGSLGSGSVTNSGGAVVFNRSDSVVVSNVISGGGLLTQAGTGTITLTANSTYVGGTSVESGVLVVNGAISASAVSVAGGATLGGVGTVGSTTIHQGATMAPGNSPGTLSINGDLVWNNGGNYDWEIFKLAEDGGVAGVDWDLVNVSGSLNLSALDGSAPFNINIFSLSGTNTAGPLANWSPSGTYAWQILQAGNAIEDFNPAFFNINTAGFSNSTVGGVFALELRDDQKSLYLTYAGAEPIPEAGTWVGAAFLLAIAFSVCRRKKLIFLSNQPQLNSNP